MRKVLILGSALLISGNAIAADAEWKSNLEVGYVQTGGNTEVSSLNAKGKSSRDGEEWRTTVQALALNVSDKVGTTAEKYDVSVQEDYKLTESGYLFGRLGFDTDRFGGFTSRTSETVGYGFDILKNDEKQWNAEVGAGARQTELTDATKNNDAIVRAATLFNWKFNPSSTFSQELKIEAGKEGSVTNSITALTNQVSGNLSSKVSFSAQNTSKVPAGNKKTNTELAIALVFTY